MNDVNYIIRHFLASIAYRFQMSLSRAPVEFGDFEAGKEVRTPHEIVRHMTHLLKYTHRHINESSEVDKPTSLTFDKEILRFHEFLKLVDRDLSNSTVDSHLLKKLVQGPISDMITHIGQLAMLSRLAGFSIPRQDFSAANIKIGRIGAEQIDRDPKSE